jgi:cytochrome b561
MSTSGDRRFGLDTRRYNLAATTLHWLIALLILTQIGLGWYMNEVLPDHSPAQDQIQSLHISLGLTTLLLVLARIAIRLVWRAPPLPADLPRLDRALARFTHGLFYALMLVLPLTGWALVSAGAHPISWWGISWPHLPGMHAFAGAQHKAARHTLTAVHTNYLIWIVLATLALHVAGALKGQIQGHAVLWRMIPGLRPR